MSKKDDPKDPPFEELAFEVLLTAGKQTVHKQYTSEQAMRTDLIELGRELHATGLSQALTDMEDISRDKIVS